MKIKILILIICCFALSSCNDDKRTPKVENGVIDLRNWDFEKDGSVKLTGDWEFYWQKYITSFELDTLAEKNFIKVPDVWKGHSYFGKILPSNGYCSYRVRILLNHNHKKLGIDVPAQGINYSLLVNDKEIGRVGFPGKNNQSSIPCYMTAVYELSNNSDTMDLIYHTSNFQYWKGGMWFANVLGNYKEIQYKKEFRELVEFAIFGSLIVSSIVLFLFYFYRKSDKITLLFSLFCFSSAIRVLCTGELLLTKFFPDFNWELIIKLELISYFVTTILFSIYIHLNNKRTFNRYLLRMNVIILLIPVIATIFFPAIVHSHLIPYVNLYIISFGIFVLIILILSVKLKLDGSLTILIGFLFSFVAAIAENLYYAQVIKIEILYPYGVMVFFFSQAILLSKRFSLALKKVENYAKDLKDEVNFKTKALREEKEKSDKLLLNVLPEPIAIRLRNGETQIAEHFEEASVVFIDIVDFTQLSSRSTPQKMVKMLNEVFTQFDKISAKNGLEKIKTIGDCYMAAAGIPIPRPDHALAIASMAKEVLETMKNYRTEDGEKIEFRIGLDCGPIVAGVIGEQKFIYDLWGDMVNTASRMETNGILGKIQCTERFRTKLLDISKFSFIDRGEIEIKGIGLMRTWLLD